MPVLICIRRARLVHDSVQNSVELVEGKWGSNLPRLFYFIFICRLKMSFNWEFCLFVTVIWRLLSTGHPSINVALKSTYAQNILRIYIFSYLSPEVDFRPENFQRTVFLKSRQITSNFVLCIYRLKLVFDQKTINKRFPNVEVRAIVFSRLIFVTVAWSRFFLL